MAVIESADQILGEWVDKWAKLDEMFELLEGCVEAGEGLSRQDLYTAFRVVVTGPPWRDPSFCVWAAVRHRAANYGDLQHKLTGCRSDTFAERGCPD